MKRVRILSIFIALLLMFSSCQKKQPIDGNTDTKGNTNVSEQQNSNGAGGVKVDVKDIQHEEKTNTDNKKEDKKEEANKEDSKKEETQKKPEKSASSGTKQNTGSKSGTSSSSSSTSTKIITVDNPGDILVVVNKKRSLNADWKPNDLVRISVPYKGSGKTAYMRKEASEALDKLFKAAKEDNISLWAVSGFRSYELQKTVFAKHVANLGETEARKISAYPGQSEHQTGLAMDISSASMGYTLGESFGKKPEGKWLAEHAHEYGFIIRYQKGWESITGYSYEPWHIRYVGEKVAKEIKERNITLEEYMGLK